MPPPFCTAQLHAGHGYRVVEMNVYTLFFKENTALYYSNILTFPLSHKFLCISCK